MQRNVEIAIYLRAALGVNVKLSKKLEKAELTIKGTDFESIQGEVQAFRETNQGLPKTVSVGGEFFFRVSRKNRKVFVVTGAAQGFGEHIARLLAERDNLVVIADLNYALASQTAESINQANRSKLASAVKVNVANEADVESLIYKSVLLYGGIDAFISNAGVLRSGPLDTFTYDDFKFVTEINYNAFYLCAKHASFVMRLQNKLLGTFSDIIQINSKSGLEGSNKNFAYAGGKFGGIGLVQSFALELCEFGIKVNAICPGNFMDGPLWCDPEKGLFVQYLRAGKVPGAKTIEDVKAFYEGKVPMKRGCLPIDVVRAILYVIEQEYETGQAVPVTGGQVMLK